MIQHLIPSPPPVDNMTNESPASSQYSDNAAYNIALKAIDTNNSNYETNNNTNYIQSVPSINSTSKQIKTPLE